MIDDTEESNVDVSVANISITLEREERMDFSYPIYDSGLTMMILSNDNKSFLLESLKDTRILISIILIALLLLTITKNKELLKSKIFKEISKKKRKHI